MVKRLLATSIIAVYALLMAASPRFSDETLDYVVSYKWGLIHKDAGNATLTLRNSGGKYNIMLTARTRSWADRFYKVRDTLLATIDHNNFKPLKYVRIAHEDGRYTRDEIDYSYTGGLTTGRVVRHKTRKGRTSVSEKTLTAAGAAYDLLSVFYYLRVIDYSRLSKGKMVVTTLFSGKEKETVRIKPVGIERVTLRDKSRVEAYHIRFNFTSDGMSKSSDDIDAWISNDSRHIPLMVVGQLPVGQIKCYYTGAK